MAAIYERGLLEIKSNFTKTLLEDFFHFKLIKICQIMFFIRDVTKTGNGKWGMGNGGWAMGNGGWGMGMRNGEWEIENERN